MAEYKIQIKCCVCGEWDRVSITYYWFNCLHKGTIPGSMAHLIIVSPNHKICKELFNLAPQLYV